MRKVYLLLAAAVAAFALLACSDKEEERLLVWEGTAGDVFVSITMLDGNTCTYASGSAGGDMFDAYRETFRYEGWYGVRRISIYKLTDDKDADPVYYGDYTGEDTMELRHVLDGEPVDESLVILTRKYITK